MGSQAAWLNPKKSKAIAFLLLACLGSCAACCVSRSGRSGPMHVARVEHPPRALEAQVASSSEGGPAGAEAGAPRAAEHVGREAGPRRGVERTAFEGHEPSIPDKNASASGSSASATGVARQQVANSVTARRAAEHGDTNQAVQRYERALELAKDNAEEQARASVSLATVLTRLSDGAGNRAATLRRAEALYKAAIDQGNAETRLLATNNYGALLVREDRGSEAVAVLSAIKERMESRPAEQKGCFQWNLARAYEASPPALDLALTAYIDALKNQPNLKAAGDRAYRLAIRVEPPEMGLSAVLRLVKYTREAGGLDSVGG